MEITNPLLKYVLSYIFANNNIYSISNCKNKVNSLLNKAIIYYSLILWELIS